MSWRRCTLLTLTTTAAALVALAAPATAHESSGYAITINGGSAFPKSVAADHQYVYATSIGDGTVYSGRTGAKKLDPFLPAGQDGRTQATGIKIAGQGYGNGPCGQDRLLQQLKDGNSMLAQISVNGDDQIATVKEIYHP